MEKRCPRLYWGSRTRDRHRNKDHRERTPIFAIFPGRIAKPIGGEVQERDRQVVCVRDRFMADELLANDSPLICGNDNQRASWIDVKSGNESQWSVLSSLRVCFVEVFDYYGKRVVGKAVVPGTSTQ